MVEFRELTMGDELMYCDYMREWIDHDEKIVPTITNITKYSNFEELVHELADNKSHDESVDNTTLFLIEDDEIIGAANIRHNLNEQLKKIGGHVGYGIRKKHRGKGFGNKILKKSLDYLWNCNGLRATCCPSTVPIKEFIAIRQLADSRTYCV